MFKTICFLLIILCSCHNFYQAKTIDKPLGNQVDSVKHLQRYFILRNGNASYYMSGVTLSADQKMVNCLLDSLPPEHKLHLHNGRRGKMQYQKTNPEEFPVLSEVHLYIQKDSTIQLGSFVLSLDKIQKIEVIEKDKVRTRESYVIGAIGYSLGTIVVATVIIAALKSSCPFVSAYDGTQFALQGEIYGGSIYPQLARDDYMPLRLKPYSDGTFQVKISNELKEKQYTDMADLLIVKHNKNARIIPDEKGNLYQISKPVSPVEAIFSNGNDVLSAISKANDDHLLYFDDTLAANAQNNVILKFPKYKGSKKAKLVMSVKNSYWLDYLYGQLAKGFGSYYNTYIKKQSSKTAESLINWTREQHMPLEVSVKTEEEWKINSYITTIGPLTTREIVVPIDLPEDGKNSVQIKLSSGFMFWEIDYAAIDYSDDNDFVIHIVSPHAAIDENGNDVLELLIKPDGRYLEQLAPGTVTTIQYHFNLEQEQDMEYSYILHTKGYYTHVRNFTNRPDIQFLRQFKRANAFPEFSLSFYKKFRRDDLQSLSKN